MRAALTALARGTARRPLLTLAVLGALAAAGAALALTLTPTAATRTLVDRSSPAYRATDQWHRSFGDDAVIVMVHEPLHSLLYSRDIVQLLGLEGCLSGNVPPGASVAGGRHGPCAQLARLHATRYVFGPATFINESANEVVTELRTALRGVQLAEARAARRAQSAAVAAGVGPAAARRAAQAAAQAVAVRDVRGLLALAQQYGIASLPGLDNPEFVQQVVFGSGITPKARFSSLFPNLETAVVQVRLDPRLRETQRARAIALIRDAVAMPQWRLAHGGYLVSGVPVIVSDLTAAITRSIFTLLAVALLVMAITLALVFPVRRRLLPLAVALAAGALTFGALALSGASLTMASVGVLPVLIGLGVDYAIQFQARCEEERSVERAAERGGPAIATAAAATAAGFAVLALPGIGSPVPMVRGFGLLLVVGVVLAFLCAIALVSAGLSLPPRARLADAWGRLAPSLRGAREILVQNAVSRAVGGAAARAGRAAFAQAVEQPRALLAVAVVLAAAGWGLGTQTRVESDVQKLVPQSLHSLRDLGTLQRSTHVGGEIDVMVSAADLTQPAIVHWMTSYQQQLLTHFGYGATRGCGTATLCPSFSLPDLLGPRLSQAQIRTLLAAVPPYFAQAVITPDRRRATLAFGIRLMPLARQEEVVAAMRRALHPPPGVRAQLVGLPVLAADANARLTSPWRRLGTLVAALLAVALVLAVALREARRVLVVLAPIVLAAGWSALVLAVLGLPLNPMSVTLGALVIAISTEFSVLLAERYRTERAGGLEPHAALARTYASTGAAVLASGVTATLGFAVLIASDIQMLRQFGLVTVIDLAVSLLGVMIALPAVLLVAERVPRAAGEPQPGLRVPRADAA